jgi:thiol-activated cytolysin
MAIELANSGGDARWESGQLVGAHVMQGAERLPWMGDSGDDRGFARVVDGTLEDGSERRVLQMHPKWVSNGTIKGWFPFAELPPSAQFRAGVGFLEGATNTDGVTFQVFAHHYESPTRKVWRRVGLLRKGYTGEIETITADLSHLAGREVAIELRVDAGDSAGQDWAVWVDPVVDVPGGNSLEVRLSRNQQHFEQSLSSGEEHNALEGTICRTERIQASETDAETLLLNPTSGVVYPGAVLDGGSIGTGEYRPIAAPRAPMTLSIELNEDQIGGSRKIEVTEPSISNVGDRINELRSRKIDGTTQAGIHYNLTKIGSQERFALSLGAHYRGTLAKFSGQLDFSSSTTTNKILVEYYQIYYEIDMDIPHRPADLFTKDRRIGDDEVYVQNMKYGRMLLFTFESSESMDKLEAAVRAEIGDFEANLDSEYRETLNKTKIHVMAIGGASEPVVELISNGPAGIQNYLEKGANYSADSPGAPLSYTLRYVNDNSVANVLLSTVYTARNCFKATGRFVISNVGIRCVKSNDQGGNNEEVYGGIWYEAHPIDAFGREREMFKEKIWKKGSSNYITIPAGDREVVKDNVQIEFDDFPNVKDKSYFRVIANIKEEDDWDADDMFGKNDIVIPLHSLAPDLNDASKPNPKADATHKIRFSKDGTVFVVSFDAVAE